MLDFVSNFEDCSYGYSILQSLHDGDKPTLMSNTAEVWVCLNSVLLISYLKSFAPSFFVVYNPFKKYFMPAWKYLWVYQ